MKPRFLTSHYAWIQGCYWMAYCILLSFSSVYLLDQGFSNTQICLLLGLSLIHIFLSSAPQVILPASVPTSGLFSARRRLRRAAVPGRRRRLLQVSVWTKKRFDGSSRPALPPECSGRPPSPGKADQKAGP